MLGVIGETKTQEVTDVKALVYNVYSFLSSKITLMLISRKKFHAKTVIPKQDRLIVYAKKQFC